MIKLPKKNGKYFIDRDAHTFQLILHYLRNSTLPIFSSPTEESNFFQELSFWKIPLIQKVPNFTFDKNWCAETLIIENKGKHLKKRNPQHGIVFVKPGLNAFSPYVEFKVFLNVPSKTKSHLFLGLVDMTKYKKNYLLSTYWKESPSAFYWDVWNTQLIKTDETGAQVLTKNGYGCDYEEYENKLAIEYNQEKRTVNFYKNDINLGTAFHNVPPNLTPALDVWFENGIIKIIDSPGPEEKIYL